MKTVHLIFNAHLDPVWLWPWPAGLDEALATCRSACDRLDAHPDLIFTRGEAWVYEQIELLDPELFARIRGHIDAGRWEIVGGWWLQPDCNQPSGLGLERQITLGRQYFEDRFAIFPDIAYNVDSFGHAATLPGLMRAAGQRHYIMMRPQEHEKALPARLFRWRGYEDGPEVVTFRIAGEYLSRGPIKIEHIQKSLTELPEGVEHTMCFVGVGDHGGGPTEQQVQWCEENAGAIPGCRLVFSSPSRFFAAVASHTGSLPLVVGDLQMHAVGCYSVHRGVKTAVRRAEHLLAQAEALSAAPQSNGRRWGLNFAWKSVCFAHFHDILGGTCLPSAYPAIIDRIGGACAVADEAIQMEVRRRMRALPDDPMQRLIFCNASRETFDGYVECEPWLEWETWQAGWSLLDEAGEPIPFQVIRAEALTDGLSRLLFRLKLEPGALATVRIDRHNAPTDAAMGVTASDSALASGEIAWSPQGLRLAGGIVIAPRLELIADESDTWSHGVERYAEDPIAVAQWSAPEIVESGALMASAVQHGTIGRSSLRAEWRVYAGDPSVHLNLRVHWQEAHKILKMTLPLPSDYENNSPTRTDGIPGGSLVRENDGIERPIRDWTLLTGHDLAIVCPDIYALDATESRVRLTLLRSSLLAHHAPHAADDRHGVFADHGVHEFRFQFRAGARITTAELEQTVSNMVEQPVYADLTRGMPLHYLSR